MKEKKLELFTRSITSIFIALYFLAFIYSNNNYITTAFLMIFATVMGFEWNYITYTKKDSYLWKLTGILYIFISLFPMLLIKNYDNNFLMWLFIIIWSTDTFAYIFGKVLGLGKHKICISISPGKSYEGLIAGIVFSIIFSYIFTLYFLPNYKNLLLCFVPIICILEQTSDFFESYIKRKFNIKDSGSILPGHGGLLDRMDGLLLTGLFLSIYLYYFNAI